MPRKKQSDNLDAFHYLEALERTYIINSMISAYLSEHPVYKKHKELTNRINKAEKLLTEAYQLIGGLSYILNEKSQNDNENKDCTRRGVHPRRKK